MNAIVTKSFKSGNSVAVRLPKDPGFDADTDVRPERRGHEVVITEDWGRVQLKEGRGKAASSDGFLGHGPTPRRPVAAASLRASAAR